MAEKEIIWSTRATVELRENLSFFNERNGSVLYSEKLLKEVENLMKMLSKNELIGRLCSNKKTRVIVKKVYLIFYEVQDDRIEILSFWNNLQDPKKRLNL